MAKNPQLQGKAKRIDIRHHFVREQVHDGSIQLKYCPIHMHEVVADMLTSKYSQQISVFLEKAGKRPFD